MSFTKTKAWKIEWFKNSGKDCGAQAWLIQNLKPGEYCITSQTSKHGRMWTNVNPEVLLKLIESNRGIYEIIVPHEKRKVYFDIDGTESLNLDAVKECILKRFPNARMDISGSVVPEKRSYHIVLSNYFFENQAAQKVLQRWVASLPKELGFDAAVYTTNRLMKCINQSKLDGRVQERVDGATDLRKHLILHGFDEDAVDAATLEWNLSILSSVKKCDDLIDVLHIPQQHLQVPDFEWSTSSPTEKLKALPCFKRGEDGALDYEILVKVMCWFKSNNGDFETFWSWCAQKDPSDERQLKYRNLWDCRDYKYSDESMFVIFKRFYPNLRHKFSSNKDRFTVDMKDFKCVQMVENEHGYLSGDDLALGFQKSPLVYVSLPMGRNKTGGTEEFLRRPENEKKSVLWISTRISYAKNVGMRLASLGFVDYKSFRTTADKEVGIPEAHRIIISPQSLHYIKGKVYDIVVYDEVESFRSIWAEEKTHIVRGRSNLVRNWRNFVRITQSAKHILLLDAFPLHSTATFYSELTGFFCQTIGSQAQSASRIMNEFVGHDHWKENVEAWKSAIVKRLKSGGNVFIYYPWKEDSEKGGWVGMETLAKSISTLTGIPECQYKVYHADTSDKDKKELADVNAVWSKLRFVISNMSITVGVNFDDKDSDEPHFTDNFTWLPGQDRPRDVIQNIGRVRANIPINIVYSPNMFGIPGFVTPEALSHDPVYRNLLTGYKQEYFSRGKTIFKLFAKQANFRFKTSDIVVSEAEILKMRKVERDTECLFRWDMILDIDESAFEALEKAVQYQEASFNDHLAYRKHLFKTMFKDGTSDEVMGSFWDNRQLNMMTIIQDIENGREPYLKRLFGNDYELPQVPNWDLTSDELKDLMLRVHVQSTVDKTKITNELISRILKALFGREVWAPQYEFIEGKRVQKREKIDGLTVQLYELTEMKTWIHTYLEVGQGIRERTTELPENFEFSSDW